MMNDKNRTRKPTIEKVTGITPRGQISEYRCSWCNEYNKPGDSILVCDPDDGEEGPHFYVCKSCWELQAQAVEAMFPDMAGILRSLPKDTH